MESIQRQVLEIIKDPTKTHMQTVFSLAEFAENLCDYPAGVPDNFQRLVEEEILCDHNDGHAPSAPATSSPTTNGLWSGAARSSASRRPGRWRRHSPR